MCNPGSKRYVSQNSLLNAIGIWEEKNKLNQIYRKMDKGKTGMLSKAKIQQGLNEANQKMTRSALKLLDINAED